MKFKHRTLIMIAGIVWFAIGIGLLTLGIRFIIGAILYPDQAGGFSLLALVTNMTGDRQNAVIILLTFALLLGLVKGRFVLAKTVQRQVTRIFSLPNPANIKHLYSKGFVTFTQRCGCVDLKWIVAHCYPFRIAINPAVKLRGSD